MPGDDAQVLIFVAATDSPGDVVVDIRFVVRRGHSPRLIHPRGGKRIERATSSRRCEQKCNALYFCCLDCLISNLLFVFRIKKSPSPVSPRIIHQPIEPSVFPLVGRCPGVRRFPVQSTGARVGVWPAPHATRLPPAGPAPRSPDGHGPAPERPPV